MDNRMKCSFDLPTALGKIRSNGVINNDNIELGKKDGERKKKLEWKLENAIWKSNPELDRPNNIDLSRQMKRNVVKRRSSSAPLHYRKFEINEFNLKIRKRPRSVGEIPFRIKGYDHDCPLWRSFKCYNKNTFSDVRCHSCTDLRSSGKNVYKRTERACASSLSNCHLKKSDSCFMKNFCKQNDTFWEKNTDFYKFKRSLKLLGFELSDFGVYGDKLPTSIKRKPYQTSSTLSTKILTRTVSLDSLKPELEKAWIYGQLDTSHRRLLAQAAYEQWYFKKKEEILKNKREEKIKKMKLNETLKKELEKKQEKAKEEFQKWVQWKKRKREERKENSPKTEFFNLKKTKEETEKAFLEWKKKKDKERELRNKEKKKEEEKNLESERQKKEKKVLAEKVFQQWKIKLDERIKEQEQEKKQKELELKRLRIREQNSNISYQIWKNMKDEEIKRKLKQFREAERIAREERLAQMEERMYEADQAFEDWLEKIDKRRENNNSNVDLKQKKTPWLPV